jgi:hypothetical protein
MKRYSTVVALGLVAIGCGASTSLVRTWRDPTYAGGDVKQVLVIGLTPKQENRKAFEYAMAARLEGMKLQPLASYDVLPKEQMAERAAIDAIVKERGIDLVLVTRLVSRNQEPEYVQTAGYVHGGYYPYYAGGYSRVYAPGYVTEREVVYLETSAFPPTGDKPVWSGVTKTFDYSSIEGVSESVADAIAKALVDQGVL